MQKLKIKNKGQLNATYTTHREGVIGEVMTLKKIVTSPLLSGALVFGGVGSAFAADHTYEPGSAQQAIAARDDALIKVNK